MVRKCDRCEHDVTYDVPVDFSNEGNVSIGFPAKPVDKIGFSRKFEFRAFRA
jgi:hypothetical protein